MPERPAAPAARRGYDGPIRALVFDFDGLILETEGPDFQSWCDLYTEHGASLALEHWLPLIGTAGEGFDAYAELERQLGRVIDRATIRSLRRQRYLELVHAQAALPGVLDYITEAERLGLGLAVASSGTRDWVEGHLERLGLRRHFSAVLTADDVPRAKPDPALYLAATAALGVKPRQAIALEDSANGLTAARRAGLYCVGVPNALTRHLPLAELADLCLTSLSDLPLSALLERAGRGAERA